MNRRPRVIDVVIFLALFATAGTSLPAKAGDETPPIVTITAPGHGHAVADATTHFSGRAGTLPGDEPSVTVEIHQGLFTVGDLVQTLVAPVIDGEWDANATSLTDGDYSARAFQSDGANTGQSEITEFKVDTVPPANVSITEPASHSVLFYAAFAGTMGTAPGDEPEINVLMNAGTALDDDPEYWFAFSRDPDLASVYAGMNPFTTPPGEYTARAYQIDRAGNRTLTPTVTFTIDDSEGTVIDSVTKAGSRRRTVEFHRSLDIGGFECAVDKRPYASCFSPFTTPKLKAGRKHTVFVRALDMSGNPELFPASRRFKVS